MILFKNTQRKVVIDKQQVISDINKLLEFLNYKDFDITIWFTTDKTIRFYNRQYRHIDKATDILSFPFHPELVAGKRIRVKSEDDRNLGDLIISPSYALKDAIKFNRSWAEHLRILIIHGIFHLLAYDHIEDNDFRRMRQKEVWLLKKLKEQD